MECVTLLPFLPVTLKITVLSRLLTVGKAQSECSRKLLVWMRTCKNVQCQIQELGLTPTSEPWMVICLDTERKITCLDVEKN